MRLQLGMKSKDVEGEGSSADVWNQVGRWCTVSAERKHKRTQAELEPEGSRRAQEPVCSMDLGFGRCSKPPLPASCTQTRPGRPSGPVAGTAAAPSPFCLLSWGKRSHFPGFHVIRSGQVTNPVKGVPLPLSFLSLPPQVWT